MPLYEYQCKKCGNDFELMRKIAQMDAPAKCAQCGSRSTKRKVSLFVARSADSSGSVPNEPEWFDGDDDHDHEHAGHGHDHGHDSDDF